MLHLLLVVIYLSFISLGLPDALLGSAWPIMQQQFSVPVSYAGVVSFIISVGTILSSLISDRLTNRFGAGRITAISVATTAVALLGFSCSGSFWMLCLWAVPYGLGAGCVDAALNNYIALHYASRHMSWLHCMWGLGCSIGPYIMGYVLTGGQEWPVGYRYIAYLQFALTAILFLSLPLWKTVSGGSETGGSGPTLTLKQILAIPGTKAMFTAFFCYCAIEQTAALWASSYLVLHKGMPEQLAATFGSMFFLGITAGRGLNGFLTIKFTDTQLIHAGQGIICLGALILLLPFGTGWSVAGLILIGLGCAPIYPCIVHSTPNHFGAERSQAIIGVQMASAYVGSCLMPPLFGLIANHLHVSLLPVFLLVLLVLMAAMYRQVLRKCR